ncbi:MAG: 2'-5' RNA ligase family protein [Christensenella sp.]|nr:2'-5' RNA ligase family protein [Christensenella sp.]
MKRAIVLFPKFENIDAIQAVRERFDPLASFIAPHITLVFPFESELSTQEIGDHVRRAIEGVKRFPVQLSSVTGDFRDGYLFLNVKRGNDEIIDLHDRLYRGVLEQYLFRKVTYCPHVTVGRLEQPTEFDQALEELAGFSEQFKVEIDRISVESIDSHEQSMIELVFDLE